MHTYFLLLVSPQLHVIIFLMVLCCSVVSISYCDSSQNMLQKTFYPNCSSLFYVHITGTLSVVKLSSPPGQPTSIFLQMEGSAAALQAVKIEIVKRVQKEFGATVLVEWTH